VTEFIDEWMNELWVNELSNFMDEWYRCGSHRSEFSL